MPSGRGTQSTPASARCVRKRCTVGRPRAGVAQDRVAVADHRVHIAAWEFAVHGGQPRRGARTQTRLCCVSEPEPSIDRLRREADRLAVRDLEPARGSMDRVLELAREAYDEGYSIDEVAHEARLSVSDLARFLEVKPQEPLRTRDGEVMWRLDAPAQWPRGGAPRVGQPRAPGRPRRCPAPRWWPRCRRRVLRSTRHLPPLCRVQRAWRGRPPLTGTRGWGAQS